MKALDNAAREVGRAWSGSNLGYHADIYTDDLRPPSRGIVFSAEWGLDDSYSNPTNGYSRYDPEDVERVIRARAKIESLDEARKVMAGLADEVERSRSSIESIVSLEPEFRQDTFVADKVTSLRAIRPRPEAALIPTVVPRGTTVSRDLEALGGGRRAGPHHRMLAVALAFEEAVAAIDALAGGAEEIAQHLARKRQWAMNAAAKQGAPIVMAKGTHVFIGHGASPVWKDLRDFVRDRVHLPFDEFNRVPVAGRSNKERLQEMMDNAAIAFLVMTGEDETATGNVQARQNVVHEAGLFQGRLGFERAIILLEAGCERFSNIDGLTYIPFPKGNIGAAFEEVRRVLEREKLIAPTGARPRRRFV